MYVQECRQHYRPSALDCPVMQQEEQFERAGWWVTKLWRKWEIKQNICWINRQSCSRWRRGLVFGGWATSVINNMGQWRPVFPRNNVIFLSRPEPCETMSIKRCMSQNAGQLFVLKCYGILMDYCVILCFEQHMGDIYTWINITCCINNLNKCFP